MNEPEHNTIAHGGSNKRCMEQREKKKELHISDDEMFFFLRRELSFFTRN